jgi:carbamoyltransferase
VADGKLVAALEEERFTRKKHASDFPERAIERCLRIAGIDYKDVDHIAVSIKPTKDIGKKTLYGIGLMSQIYPFLRHEVVRGAYRQYGLRTWCGTKYNGSRRPPIHFIPHHLAHAAGAFMVSPYEDAAILSLDGSGEWATSFLGRGRGIDVECFNESFFPMSLGSFYEAATQFCGFKANYDEGKTMGLAPFGDPAVYYPIVSKIATVDNGGGIHIDLSFFSYQSEGPQRCSRKFYETFGIPRKGGGEFAENHNNVAAAFQKALEECGLKMAGILRERTKARHLVLAGGVALNSVMNGRILRESGFEDIYVMPGAGDNGSSIGAAYYLYNAVLRNKRAMVHDDPYVGTVYTNQEIEKLLKECKLSYEKHDDICGVAAKLLAEGSIIGWLQGRMEFGPRALGNRSILANPAFPEMKDKINREVKHREAYRPFAPSTPTAEKDRFFDIKGDSPFMLKVCDVWPNMRSVIPAITHVDGTARLQTVDPKINPRYHELLTKFGQITGIPVLLNTSFNIAGEPIVESPHDAIRCFFSTGLDQLILGDYLVKKK